SQPMIRRLGIIACCTLLAACSPMREVKVQPVTTAMDSAAIAAGELRIANSALASGDLEVALSLFQRITAAYPDNLDGWIGFGNALYLSGDISQARQAYQAALERDGNQLDALLGLARMDVRQRKLDDARLRYQQALQAWPDNPLAMAGMGVTYDLAG